MSLFSRKRDGAHAQDHVASNEVAGQPATPAAEPALVGADEERSYEHAAVTARESAPVAVAVDQPTGWSPQRDDEQSDETADDLGWPRQTSESDVSANAERPASDHGSPHASAVTPDPAWEDPMAPRATSATDEPVGIPVHAAPPAQRTPSEHRDKMLLGELLVQHKYVSRHSLAKALAEQPESGLRLGTLLVKLGMLGDRELAQALGAQLGLPVVDLREESPQDDALTLLPEKVAREKEALPLRVTENVLYVAVADPEDDLQQVLSTAAGRTVSLVLAPRSDILQALNRSYRVLDDVQRYVDTLSAEQRPRAGVQEAAEVAAEDAPVIRIVNLLVTQALRDRASDVHIEPQESTLRVRYRVDGALHDALSLPGSLAPALISRLKILAGMNIVERRRPQDGQITMTVDNREIDLRVATTATIWGEKCVLRLLDKNRSLLRLHELGMPEDTHESFAKMVRSPFGMVLCAGPTGSGKTTTLYATLEEINEPHRNIMTIEDPVEYVLPSINQIQMNEAAGITFATGLKSILRQDPDIILVGEIRDVDTARIAVQSALTGHFVLSSLHATDSVAALHRFLDMGIESFLIASSVVGIVGQRLVRRMCSYCKQPYQPNDEEMAFYVESGGPEKSQFFRGAGCNFCSGTGYRDRVGVYEFLRMTPELKRLVVGWATQEELRRMAVSQGMRTLQEEALALVNNDVTTISEVVRAIYAS